MRLTERRPYFLASTTSQRDRGSHGWLESLSIRVTRRRVPGGEPHSISGAQVPRVSGDVGGFLARRDTDRRGDVLRVSVPTAHALAVDRHRVAVGRGDGVRDIVVPRAREPLVRLSRRLPPGGAGAGVTGRAVGGDGGDKRGIHVQRGVPHEHTLTKHAVVRVRGGGMAVYSHQLNYAP